VIWLVGLFWSPESAFFVTLVWWPCLATRDAEEAVAAGRSPVRALVRGAARGVVALALGSVGLALTVWLLARRDVTLGDFLVYVQHPPGPLPVNPLGTVWLALAVVLLALSAIARRPVSARTRCLYVGLLGLLGAGSYFLSRSHDNNVLNLFPLLVPVLVGLVAVEADEQDGPAAEDAEPATGRRSLGFESAFVRTVLAAMVAFVPLFDVASWSEGASRDGLLAMGPAHALRSLVPEPGDRPQLLDDDAVAGLTYLRAHDAGQVVLLSDEKVLPRAPAGSGWTGVNDLANVAPLPESLVRHYVRRGASAYRCPGWLLVDEARFGRWVGMFRSAYAVRETKRFGSYTAYLMAPRADVREPG
jgi:hypothetical protein